MVRKDARVSNYGLLFLTYSVKSMNLANLDSKLVESVNFANSDSDSIDSLNLAMLII